MSNRKPRSSFLLRRLWGEITEANVDQAFHLGRLVVRSRGHSACGDVPTGLLKAALTAPPVLEVARNTPLCRL